MKKILLVISSLLALALVSCKKEIQSELIPATGISLSQTTLSMLPGEQVELKAVVSPDNSTSKYVTWESSDSKVATVDVWGRVNALTPGETIITATSDSGKNKATCKVTVNAIVVTSVAIEPASASVYMGETVELSATVSPSDASDKSITWTSSDEAIATVNAEGVVTGVELGEVKIIATAHNGVKAECLVSVKVRVPEAPETLDMWKSDKAGYRGLFGADADNGKTAGEGGWLSYKDGVAYWTENTTGKARKATLTLSTGSVITISQVEAKDLAGEYTFYNYSFKAAGVSSTVVVDQSGRQHETAVRFEAVENPVALNGHEHNLNLVGLYLDFKLPASFEVVDGVPVIYTYLSDTYQKLDNGTEAACITELTNTTAYGTGYFAPVKFGPQDCNYAWIAWGLEDLFGSPRFTIGTGEQRLVTEGLYCCGFSFVLKGYKENGYTTIYQFNYKNKWIYSEEGGAYFAKK